MKKKINDERFNNIIIVLCVAIIALLGIIVYKDVTSDSTYKIAKRISNKFEHPKLVGKIGKDTFSYLNATYVYDNDEKVIEIAKYGTSLEAKLNMKYIEKYYTDMHNKYDKSVFSKYDYYKDDILKGEDDLVIVDGNYLIIVSSKVKNYKDYQYYFSDILDEFDTTDLLEVKEKDAREYYESKLTDLENKHRKYYEENLVSEREVLEYHIRDLDNCLGTVCEDILNEISVNDKYTDLADIVEKAKIKYNEVINLKKEKAKMINNKISEIEKDPTVEKCEVIGEEIRLLNDTFYDKYREEWAKRIANIYDKLNK